MLSASTHLYFVTWCAYTGELPLEIIRMKAQGIIPIGGLSDNVGFTLPSDIGELTSITELDHLFTANQQVASNRLC